MKRVLATSVLLVASAPTLACSITHHISLFEQDPKVRAESVDYAHLPAIPKVTAELVKVTRANHRYSCDFSAELQVKLTWKAESKLRLEDYGFYFKVVEGPYKYDALSGVPLKPTMKDGVGYFTFHVPDKPLEHHAPIDMKVEVFGVDKYLQIGPSTVVTIHVAGD